MKLDESIAGGKMKALFAKYIAKFMGTPHQCVERTRMTTNTFFTSDNHFWHRSIQKFCPNTRFGKDVEEMNELMIQAHNAKVPPNATVYFLGDFSFGNAQQTLNILHRLNGHKHLIYGNHDKVIRSDQNIQRCFETVQEYKSIHINNVKVVMLHYPMREWDQMHRGAYHLHGHTHGSIRGEGRMLDVGIDNRPTKDMAPWSWEEIDDTLSRRPILKHHHGDWNVHGVPNSRTR